MQFDDLLSYLGKLIGEPNLKPDSDRRIELTLGADETVLTLQEVPELNVLYACCEIGELPLGNREEIMEQALCANWMFKSTGGANIAINPDTKRLAINQYWYLDVLDETKFEKAINQFLESFKNWKNLLREYVSSREINSENILEKETPVDDSNDSDKPLLSRLYI